MKYYNGDLYRGYWKNNLFHGYGVYVKNNEYKYAGDF